MSELIDVHRVKEIIGCSIQEGYKTIRTLNSELEEKGFLTIRGKVNESYLRERFKLEKRKTSDPTDQSNSDV